MATTDLSRSAFDPRKHYAGVRMQQGRVFIDDDFNENERARIDESQRALVEIVGPQGSPDTGFQIANPRVTVGQLDFDILPGAFYLGGMRLRMEEPAEPFSAQSDWLQQPQVSSHPQAGHIDMVYLEAWQQPVSAVEDSELFEVALGGPDTSTRIGSRSARVSTAHRHT